MDVFQGQPAHPGVAIAAAARLTSEYGVPTLDPQRLRRLGERLRRFGIEAPEADQIILIADEVPPGFLGVPGLDIVGIATQQPPGAHAMFTVPTVCGLGDTLLEFTPEDEIVIIDADRGRVYVEPDATVLARYQSPLRRSRRFFLGGLSLPARTASDNRIVSVLALAPTLAAVAEAMETGADGVLVPPGNDFLGAEGAFQTADDQEDILRRVMDILGGQPLVLHVPPDRLALSALARAADSGPVHLVLDDLAQRDDLAERLEHIESVLDDQDIQYGTVHLEAGVVTDSEEPPLDSLDGFTGACVVEILDGASVAHLLPIAGLARRVRAPLSLFLHPADWLLHLPDALALGADRLVTTAETVPAVKDAIRHL